MLCHRSSRRPTLQRRLARRRAGGVKSCADSKQNRSCKSLRQQTCSPEKSRPESDKPSIKFTVRYLRTQQYSINALTDSSGTIKERYAYDAYGNLSIFDASGTARTSTAEGNRCTYTGREYDDVLDLYHYRARMYNAIAGRFCSRDPIGYEDGLNLYSYTGNMPLTMNDPMGTVMGGRGGIQPITPARNRRKHCGKILVACRTRPVYIDVYADSELGFPAIAIPWFVNANFTGQGCVTYPFGIHCTHSSCDKIKNARDPHGKEKLLDHEACHVCAFFDFPKLCWLTWAGTIKPSPPDPCHGNGRPTFPQF